MAVRTANIIAARGVLPSLLLDVSGIITNSLCLLSCGRCYQGIIGLHRREVIFANGTSQTSLGPRGMDKMIQNGKGHTLITNDGHTILKDMAVMHPAAKMVYISSPGKLR